MLVMSTPHSDEHSSRAVGLHRLAILALLLALCAVSLAAKLKPADSHTTSLSSYWSVGTYVLPDRFIEDDPKAVATVLGVEVTPVSFHYELPFLPSVPVAAVRTGNAIRAPPVLSGSAH